MRRSLTTSLTRGTFIILPNANSKYLDWNYKIRRIFMLGKHPPRYGRLRRPPLPPRWCTPSGSSCRTKHLCGGTPGELWIDDCGMRIEASKKLKANARAWYEGQALPTH